jgi:hypothetical protein
MPSRPDFKNKGGLSPHILGVGLTTDALNQALVIAESKIRDRLEGGIIEERDFEKVLAEVRTRLGEGRLKFAPLKDWCAVSLDVGIIKELEGPNEAIEEFKRLKEKYGHYITTVNDRHRPRTKPERISGHVVEYRTISLPDFTSKALQKAVEQGIIPAPAFKSWFLDLVEFMARLFEESTRYKKAAKGLKVRLVIVHPQQGVLHFHFAFVKVDDNGNRLGLIGQKGLKGGGGRLVTNDLGLWAIAMRRLKKMGFEPVPVVLTRKGLSSVVAGWELLEYRLGRCTKLKATDTGRARDQGLGPTWDMQLNDSLDAEVAKLRVAYPLYDRICVEEEAVARAANAAKARNARNELGITAKLDNLQLAKQLDKGNAQLADLRNTLVETNRQLAAVKEDGKIAAERLARVEGRLLQVVELTGPLTPAMLKEVDEAWWRSVYGLNTAVYEGFLTETFFRRLKSEIAIVNPAFDGKYYSYQVLGERLCPTVFGPTSAQTAPFLELEAEEPAKNALTRDSLERYIKAWELSYYDRPTSGYEAYLTDGSLRWIAHELRSGNPVFGKDRSYVRILGEQLRPGFLRETEIPFNQVRVDFEEKHSLAPVIGRRIEFNM